MNIVFDKIKLTRGSLCVIIQTNISQKEHFFKYILKFMGHGTENILTKVKKDANKC